MKLIEEVAASVPKQGADARPVAIYQIKQAPKRWTDVPKDVFDAWASDKRIVYATRDATPSAEDARPVAITAQNFDSRFDFCKHYTGIKDDTDDKQCLCEGNREVGSWCARDVCPLLATRDAAPSDAQDVQGKMAMEVYGGINALRRLLNITTEFDRKDVRTRQAARLLDDYFDKLGVTNRDHLEHLWKTLHDKLPEAEVLAYLRAYDKAVAASAPKEKKS